jgi:hypothetical protein
MAGYPQRFFEPIVAPRVVETQTVRVSSMIVGNQTGGTDYELPVLVLPDGKAKMKRVAVAVTTAVDSGTNYWTFDVLNKRTGNSLLSTTFKTESTTLMALTRYALGIDQNLTGNTFDLFTLKTTNTGTPGNITGLFVQVDYEMYL